MPISFSTQLETHLTDFREPAVCNLSHRRRPHLDRSTLRRRRTNLLSVKVETTPCVPRPLEEASGSLVRKAQQVWERTLSKLLTLFPSGHTFSSLSLRYVFDVVYVIGFLLPAS
jgi:hypothetical protein